MTKTSRGFATAVLMAGLVATIGAQSAGPEPKKGEPAAPSKTATPSVQKADFSAGPNNGYYCLPNLTAGIGVHNLGWIASGSSVRVQIDRDSTTAGTESFDPAAAVLFVRLGKPVGDTADIRFSYDDDSGGDLDPVIEFTAPASGTYILVVNDYTDKVPGCYRYRVEIR